jgi:predicted dienelactone hydrolase
MNKCVRSWRNWHWLALICLLLPAAALARSPGGVGFSAIEVPDPINGGTMPGFVFYPSASAKGITEIGSYQLQASRDSAADPGAKPLVVISHGHGGSDLGHHDLATYLASHGFVVATISHPKDNFRDSSGDGQPEVLSGRPIQISATITHLLQNPRWKPLIDPDRIGVAGFSNGGYTALRVVGAEPDFRTAVPHCKLHPDDLNICVPLAKLAEAAVQNGRTVEQAVDALQRGLGQWGKTSDPRVKAAFVMAPFSSVFDAAGLASVSRPVFLYYGQDDHVLLPRYNVLHIAPLIRTLSGVEMIPNAGHYVFLSPCSESLAEDQPELCQDPPGVNRVAVHRQINARALAFFRMTLHVKAR